MAEDSNYIRDKIKPILEPLINACLTAKPDNVDFFCLEWLISNYCSDKMSVNKDREDLENLRIFMKEPFKYKKESYKPHKSNAGLMSNLKINEQFVSTIKETQEENLDDEMKRLYSKKSIDSLKIKKVSDSDEKLLPKEEEKSEGEENEEDEESKDREKNNGVNNNDRSNNDNSNNSNSVDEDEDKVSISMSKSSKS